MLKLKFERYFVTRPKVQAEKNVLLITERTEKIDHVSPTWKDYLALRGGDVVVTILLLHSGVEMYDR